MCPPPSIPARPEASPARLTFARPLVGMDCIKSFLGLNEDAVRAEIAAGRLKWAFDLRAHGERQFLRVLSLSLIGRLGVDLKQPDSLEAAIDAILPAASRTSGTVRSTTLQSSFNVGGEHIRRLLHARKLKSGRRGRCRPGVPLVLSRASVVSFLRAAHTELLDKLSYNTCAVKRDDLEPNEEAQKSISITE